MAKADMPRTYGTSAVQWALQFGCNILDLFTKKFPLDLSHLKVRPTERAGVLAKCLELLHGGVAQLVRAAES